MANFYESPSLDNFCQAEKTDPSEGKQLLAVGERQHVNQADENAQIEPDSDPG